MQDSASASPRDAGDAASVNDARDAASTAPDGGAGLGGCVKLVDTACGLRNPRFCEPTRDAVESTKRDHGAAAAERACDYALDFFLDPRMVQRSMRTDIQPTVATSGAAPAARGGEITGGTYFLTAMQGFPHPSCERTLPENIYAVFVFGAATPRAGLFNGATSILGGGSEDHLFFEEVVLGATLYTASGTAPGFNFGTPGLEYTAESDKLVLVWKMSDCTWVSTFARR